MPTLLLSIAGVALFLFAAISTLKKHYYRKKFSRYLSYPAAVVVIKNGNFLLGNDRAKILCKQFTKYLGTTNLRSFVNKVDERMSWSTQEKQYVLELDKKQIKKKIINTAYNNIQVCYYLLAPKQILDLNFVQSFNQNQAESFAIHELFQKIVKNVTLNNSSFKLLPCTIAKVKDRKNVVSEIWEQFFTIVCQSIMPMSGQREVVIGYHLQRDSILIEVRLTYKASVEDVSVFTNSTYTSILKAIKKEGREAIVSFDMDFKESSNYVVEKISFEMNFLDMIDFLSSTNSRQNLIEL